MLNFEKPMGYDEVQAVGEFTPIELGGHKLIIKKIELPGNLTTIYAYGFENCTTLESIVIPSKVSTIGGSAFKGCSSLNNVEIKSNVLETTGSSI